MWTVIGTDDVETDHDIEIPIVRVHLSQEMDHSLQRTLSILSSIRSLSFIRVRQIATGIASCD
jgi:hypothetical protein